MIKHLLFLLFLLSIHFSQGQYNRSFQSSKEMLQVVFNDLKKVAESDGSRDFFLDSIRVVETNDKVAYQINNQIGIEKKALKICWELGERAPDALAALLSHEIAHFLYHFKEPVSPVEFASTKRNSLNEFESQQVEALEEEADNKGIFLAFRAGYKTDDILPKLQEVIYQEYDLPNKLNGYPSLERRQELAKRAGEKAKALGALFRLANLLTIAGEYKEAGIVYGHINNQHRSKEFLNNTGVCYALEALALIEEKAEFIYPFELDGRSRLIDHTRLGVESYSPKIISLLENALFYLKRSKQLDESYITAWVNFASVNDLLKESFEAEYAIEKALSLIRKNEREELKKQKANAFIVRSIIYAHKNEKKKAFEYLRKAESLNVEGVKELLKVNRKALAGNSIGPKPAEEDQLGIEFESLINFPINRIQQLLPADTSIILKTNPFSFIRLRDTSQTQIMIFQKGKIRATDRMLFHQTEYDFKGSTEQGIKMGDASEKVKKIYRRYKSKQIYSPYGYYLIYHAPGIIFEFDSNGKVISWCVFMV